MLTSHIQRILKGFLVIVVFAGAFQARAQSCVPGTWQSPPNAIWETTNGAFPVQAESARFQIRWPADKPNLMTREQAMGALAAMEKVLDWMTGTVKWPEPFCDTNVKHKVQIFSNDGYGLSGAGGGDRSPAMWVGPGALIAASQGLVDGMVHEFTHSLQFHSRGMRDTNFGGWLWESHAEFITHQYPGTDNKIGCSVLQAWMPHIYFGSTRVRYCNWQFWDFLKNKYGFPVVNDIFLKTAGMTGQDPFIVLMRNQGWTAAQLGDEFGQFAMRNINWEYTDSQDGFDRGSQYRAAFGPITDLGIHDFTVSKRLRLARMEAIDLANRRFVVSKFFAPQRYGYNHVKLIPDAGASKVTVDFRGVVQAAMAPDAEVGTGLNQPSLQDMPKNPASNWRWGLVAIDVSGKARYSALQKGASGTLDFALNAGDQGVYLVVAAAPDVHHSILWDQAYHTLYRYPFKIQVKGALPDGFQPGFQNPLIAQYPAGNRHPNGGGWVASGATVDPTAYVGPNAAVVGGSVQGNARIEDYATVWKGVIKDNAVIGGLTQPNTTFTAAENARVQSVMAGGQSFGNNQTVSGTAILFGDLELQLDSTPLRKGAFSGFLDINMSTRTEFGASRTQVPPEVTAVTPAGWPADGVQPPVNAAPVVGLTAPANNATFVQGSVIAIAATATDSDGTVAKVELFDNGYLIGTDSAAPFRWTWKGAVVGKHAITAKATDNSGATTISAARNITILAPSATPPGNAVKCANQDRTCVLPAGKTATVWFGAWNAYRVLTGASGTIACTAAAFGGDPIFLVKKACYFVANP